MALFIIAIFLAVRENHSRTRKNGLFMVLCINVLLWILLDIAEMLVTSIPMNIFVWNLGIVPPGFAAAILFLIMFKFFYPNAKLPKFAKVLVFTIPVLTALFALTTNFHPFIRYAESLEVWPREITYTRGPWFFVHTIGAMLNTLAGVVVLVKAFSKKMNNRAASLFLAGILMMLAGVALNMMSINLMNIDPASISSGLALIFMHMALTDSSQSILFRVLNTLKSRITFPVVTAVYVLIVVLVLYAARTARLLAEDFDADRAAEATGAVRAYLEANENKTFVAATALGDSAELIRRIRAGDRLEIWQYLADRQDFWGVDAIIASDANGITLARSHMRDSYGDDITGVESIAAGLRGEQITLYTPTPTAPIVMTSTSPIMDGDELLGSVVVNFDVGMNEMLDRLKETFGVDAMVFRLDGEGGAFSASSTITNPETGGRAIYSPAEPEIAAAVLGRGETFSGETEIFGIPYHAYFFPLPGVDGRPNGMLFLGISQEQSLAAIGVMDSIGQGNFNVELEKLPGKKIILNQKAEALMTNLKSVIAEVGGMVDAAAVKGELSFQIEADRYSGGWREIMTGLNSVAQAVDAPISEIQAVMGNLSHGDFSAKVSGDYSGSFLQIKDAVNSTIDTLSEYVAEINDTLSRLAGGDLTHSISRNYVGSFSAIKDSLNNISASLNKTMSEISIASAQVLSGAKQISSNAADLANSASTQSSSIQELNASIDLINQQTQQNAANAHTANELSRTSTVNAQEGNNAMQQTLDAMNQIKEASDNISKIIRTIQDISFQTNLLALNAAVEAARAGEHGKGFSVVAEEVRSLAARSQTAAGETTELIGRSINSVESGSEIAKSTASALNTIVDNANKVLEIISAISEASKEQAEAISQVGLGLQQISQVVQSNSAVSQETAAASEELNSQAELLRQLVGYFRL